MEKTLYFYHIFIILKDNIIKLIVASQKYYIKKDILVYIR